MGKMNLLVTLLLAAAPPAMAAPPEGPSRPPTKGCTWEKISDAKVGLEAWVQRCDFGFRQIHFMVKGRSLLAQYSDGGEPTSVVDVFDLQPGESREAGVTRLFAERTDKLLAQRCVMAPYEGGVRPPGVKRFTFVPNESYRRELNAKADPNEVPPPPCGEWGDTPDGIQYFETQPKNGARRVLFVRVGQDEPLFDEQTLRLLP